MIIMLGSARASDLNITWRDQNLALIAQMVLKLAQEENHKLLV